LQGHPEQVAKQLEHAIQQNELRARELSLLEHRFRVEVEHQVLRETTAVPSSPHRKTTDRREVMDKRFHDGPLG